MVLLTLALSGILCLGGCGRKENEKITFIEQLNNPAYTVSLIDV